MFSLYILYKTQQKRTSKLLSETQLKEEAANQLTVSLRHQSDEITDLNHQIDELSHTIDDLKLQETRLLDGLRTIIADTKDMQSCMQLTVDSLILISS